MSPNKTKITRKQDSFIRDNYKTMNGFQLSAGTGLTHRVIKRRMSELGLVRTDAEKKAVWAKRRLPDPKEISKRNQKIEGGGRGKNQAKYHLDKWNAKNGTFSNKHMLVYKNGKFDDYNDLKLIRKWRYDIFVKERDDRFEQAKKKLIKKEQKEITDKENRKNRVIEKEKKAVEKKKKDAIKEENRKKRTIEREKKEAEKKQKREIVLAVMAEKKVEKEKIEKAKRAENAKKMAISSKKLLAAKKNKEAAEERQKKLEEIKANSPKTMKEFQQRLVKEEKVPVKLDHKTTIYVKKSLCTQLENGTWVKATPLNIVQSNKPKKHEKPNDKIIDVSEESRESSEPNIEAMDGTTGN